MLKYPMKGVLVILVFLIGFSSFVLALIFVDDLELKESYYPGEILSGVIDLTIDNGDYNSLITSSEGDEILLIDFLERNNAFYECTPGDCEGGYSSLGEVNTGQFFVGGVNDRLIGFVVYGENVFINNIKFDLSSDFGYSTVIPLKINFFGNDWQFSNFSNTFSSKNWGCYNTLNGVQGERIGGSPYCEEVLLNNTNVVRAGTSIVVGGAEINDLLMSLWKDGFQVGSCYYNHSIGDEDCRIEADPGNYFVGGEYIVCASSKSGATTNYFIKQETTGESCGYTYVNKFLNASRDFGIFARTAQYDNSSSLSLPISPLNLAGLAEQIVQDKYQRDCSEGCVLPLVVSGVEQNLQIKNVELDYTSNGINKRDTKVYNIGEIPAMIDFKGLLELNFLNFSIKKEGPYSLYLGDEEIFSENLEEIPSPKIISLWPNNPPAGIKVNFSLNVDFDPNVSLTYKWNFGNNSTYQTAVPNVGHMYPELKNYTILVEILWGNDSISKTFFVQTISPEVAINFTLEGKNNSLNQIKFFTNSLPEWYREDLRTAVGLSFYQDSIDRLAKKRDNPLNESSIVSLVQEVFNLDSPRSIFVEELNGFPLLTSKKDIDVQTILSFAGGSNVEDPDPYRNAILNWQSEFIQAKVYTKKFDVIRWDGSSKGVMRTYKMEITPLDTVESYLVIGAPFDDTKFKDTTARKVGEKSIIILEPEELKIIEFFYINDTAETGFFVSPKLSYLPTEDTIDATCNFNLICEEENGENPNTCRADCKPVSLAIFYIGLSIIFMLFVYTLLQVWYKRRYESYLFEKDRRQMFNLLMYIANARARGLMENDIKNTLKKQGWSTERINYVIKKSKGERTGLPEIIPIGKISAFFRNRAERKKIVTDSKQQIERNINKLGYREPPKRFGYR